MKSDKATAVYRSEDTKALRHGDLVSSWGTEFEWDESCVEAHVADKCVTPNE